MSAYRSNGRPTQRRPVEEIDLTLSPSPEPQPRPRPRPRPSFHNTPGIVKSEPQPSRQAPRVKEEPMSARHPRPMQTTRQRGPQVDPAHLARIIDTSEQNDVRTVLITLCNLSPALSGAVARGLAQHSSFAQDLLAQYASAQDARPTTSPGDEHGSSGQSDSSILMSSPHLKPFVKNERPISPAPSDASSSTAFSEPLDARPASLSPAPQSFPGAFPRSPKRESDPTIFRQATLFRPSTKNIPAGSIASSSRSFGNAPNRFTKPAPKQVSGQTCINCDAAFEDDSEDECFYHTGRKGMAFDDAGQRIMQWSCCKGDEYSFPCRQGNHVAAPVSALDSLKRPRPTAEPSPFLTRTSKNPKLR